MQLCPFYCLVVASPLPLDVMYLFLVGSNIILWMVVEQLIVISVFSQEKMNMHPSTPPSWDRFIQNWKRSTSRLYIVTLFIELTCRIHHVKCWAGWSTSWKQDCWEKYQWPQICRWHHPWGRKRRGTKETLDESERGEWENCLKTQHSKTKIMASGPITSWQVDRETWKQWQTLLFWAPKSLQMVTAAMKLKDVCSLEEKLWPTYTVY